MTDVLILGWIDFEGDDRKYWLDNAEELMKATRAEPGCVRHVIVPDPFSKSAIITHAHYKSKKAFQEHSKSEHFRQFSEKIAKARVREKKVDRFEGKKVS